MMVSPTSKHKELVFDMIRYVTSEANQLEMTKNARMTALDNAGMKARFGENLKVMQGKNLTAALKTKSAAVNPSDYDVPVSGLVNKAGTNVGTNKKDINTALREAQEEADKLIAAEAAKSSL
jgi:multiple sugar transport system substrate-binding protein